MYHTTTQGQIGQFEFEFPRIPIVPGPGNDGLEHARGIRIEPAIPRLCDIQE